MSMVAMGWLAAGTALGALLAYLALRLRTAGAQARTAAERAVLDERLAATQVRLEEADAQGRAYVEQIDTLQHSNAAQQAQLAELHTRLDEAQRTAAEKLALLDEAQHKLKEAFEAAAGNALKSNNQAFLELAKSSFEGLQKGAQTDLDGRRKAIDALVAPLGETLAKLQTNLQSIEKARGEAYGGLRQQLQGLSVAQAQLQRETSTLAQALRAPTVRGRWGEIQLKRVVELAGMVERCDFTQQTSREGEGGRQRPDLIVRLPNAKQVIVDAKAPLQAYLEALEATDEASRRLKLAEHAQQVRRHLLALGGKAYWSQFTPTPEFVVMFLPGEMFFSAALEQDPSLIEAGSDKRVILATPTTLIALLRAVAYGWRQEQVQKNAEDISRLGRTLHQRLGVLVGHFATLRKGLDTAVKAYNDTVGSLEQRVLASARQFESLGAGSAKQLQAPDVIDRNPRRVKDDGGEVAPALPGFGVGNQLGH